MIVKESPLAGSVTLVVRKEDTFSIWAETMLIKQRKTEERPVSPATVLYFTDDLLLACFLEHAFLTNCTESFYAR